MTAWTEAEEGPRVIEAAAVPARFARGWHCLGLAAPFRDGTPHEVEAFGTRLVVFRGEDTDDLHVLNAYCPHMGGNLAHGTVKDDTLACPFHDWRWSGDGRCAAIPYARRVPPRARTRAWTTLERNGQLYVWHDPEGNPPPPASPSRTSRGWAAPNGATGAGTSCAWRTPTAGRSSTTSWTWRTSTTCTTPSRTTSRTSSTGRSPPSTWNPPRAATSTSAPSPPAAACAPTPPTTAPPT